jgi:hypothetical protein
MESEKFGGEGENGLSVYLGEKLSAGNIQGK